MRRRRAAATWLQGVDEDAQVLLRIGFTPQALASFAGSGSLAARLALVRLCNDRTASLTERGQAAAWLAVLPTHNPVLPRS